MRKRRISCVVAFIVITVLMITACAKKSEMNIADSTTESAPNFTSGAVGMANADGQKDSNGEVAQDFDVVQGSGAYGVELTNTSAVTYVAPKAQSQDKIIRRVNMDVETQEFDQLIDTINNQIAGLGGYVESANITGQRYYYSTESRSGNIVVRIPKDKLNEFVNIVDKNWNVINKNETTENVTLQYIDAESYTKSLKIEQDRLFVLLEKTDTLENIITLESRLSEIRYELQKYESQLRSYDNQVEYSTVTLSVIEVERITPITPVKKTVTNRIKTGFSDTMYSLSEGCKNFFVWFVVNLPYIIIWGVIIAAIVLFIRRYYRKKNIKNNATRPEQTENK